MWSKTCIELRRECVTRAATVADGARPSPSPIRARPWLVEIPSASAASSMSSPAKNRSSTTPACRASSCGECFERLIEGEHVHTRRLSSGRHVVQAHHRGAAAALACVLPAGVIDEDLAHQLRRDRKKVRPVLQRQPVDIHESQVNLMHERCRLEGVPGLFAPQMAARHAAQLVVDERHQTVERLGVALAPGQEQCSYVIRL